jgi:hypothetical protein
VYNQSRRIFPNNVYIWIMQFHRFVLLRDGVISNLHFFQHSYSSILRSRFCYGGFTSLKGESFVLS